MIKISSQFRLATDGLRFFSKPARSFPGTKTHRTFLVGLYTSWSMAALWRITYRNDLNTRPRFNIKMSSYRYRKYPCGDKMVLRSSYLQNGFSYTGKMISLYWIEAQVAAHGLIWRNYKHDFAKFYKTGTCLWKDFPGCIKEFCIFTVAYLSLKWCHQLDHWHFLHIHQGTVNIFHSLNF